MDFHYGKHAKKIVHDFTAAYLKERGYRKRAANFTRTGKNLIQTINIQSSQYNDQHHYTFYINIGVSPLGYKEKHCPPGPIFSVYNNLFHARVYNHSNLEAPMDALEFCRQDYEGELKYLTHLHNVSDEEYDEEKFKAWLRNHIETGGPTHYGLIQVWPSHPNAKRWLEI